MAGSRVFIYCLALALLGASDATKVCFISDPFSIFDFKLCYLIFVVFFFTISKWTNGDMTETTIATDHLIEADSTDQLASEFEVVGNKMMATIQYLHEKTVAQSVTIDQQATRIAILEGDTSKMFDTIGALEADNAQMAAEIHRLKQQAIADRDLFVQTVGQWRQRMENFQQEAENMLLQVPQRYHH